MVDEEHRRHDELVEEIVSGDDEQLERYLSGDTPSASELEKTLAHEVLHGSEFPVLVGSASTGVGVDRLVDFICELGPSPADRPVTVLAGSGADGVEVEVAADPTGKPLAYVFKTVADQFVGQVSLFKVLSGTIAVDDRLVNTTTGAEERLHGLFHLRGKEHVQAGQVVAGDLAAVAKLNDTVTGSTLAPRTLQCGSTPPHLQWRCTGSPCAPSRSPTTTSSRAPWAPVAEDPALVVDRNEETGQTVLRGTGDTHLSVALERLARKFGVNVETEDVRVPTGRRSSARPRPRGRSRAVGRPRAVRRGDAAGQPDRAGRWVAVRQLDRRRHDPQAVHPRRAARRRGDHGDRRCARVPVVDVRVECYDGKYHSVDSSDMAFRSAAAHGLKEALAKAGAAVLEPVSVLTVTVPEGYQGDVLGDLNSRRGRVSGTSVLGNGNHEIVAFVPAAEIQRYAVDLRSMTGGRGTFVAVHDHYDLLPNHLIDKIKKASAPNVASVHEHCVLSVGTAQDRTIPTDS